ncbi:uncharacterized protein LOC105781382 [Gossypium raimondii]|uniref:uncharacterized protein LOC105781382 n=1 Tax=Gossypium raimondii TaxID=29730 RepID=UPI00063AD560|nr:uncharacterized protein LOC105781382 [Gossypium raimondii]
MEMKMIDVASGGALVNMTPQRARELISTMAANSQQFRPATEPTRRVHGLSSLSVEDKIDKLKGSVDIKKAMCDLGTSMNVMPLSIYKLLNAGPLKETCVIIQLADRSAVHPEGVLEDILVKVNELIFPTDFYHIGMEDEHSTNSSNILLWRPFLSTTQTTIDVRNGILIMEFDGKVVKFNVYEAMNRPNFDPIEELEEWITFEESVHETVAHMKAPHLQKDLGKFLELSPSQTKLLPSILKAPELELKPLLDHLKHAFLDKGNTLLVIISSKLSKIEEENLVHGLRDYKEVIEWTITNIKGLSPLTYMHKIQVVDNAIPKREAQRHLNPPMIKVVNNEVQKLLDAGMIYPIYDSNWVSPVHVVLKITGVTIIENSADSSGTNESREDDVYVPICLVYLQTDVVRTLQCTSHVSEVYGFYRRFIKDFSKIAQLLCNLLQKDKEFEFDQSCRDAFDTLKHKLILAPIVQPPNWNYPIRITYDTCDHSVGVVLGQKIEKEPHVISYASNTVDATQSNYLTTEKEFLAIVFALEKFRSYLLGTKIVVFSDHKRKKKRGL